MKKLVIYTLCVALTAPVFLSGCAKKESDKVFKMRVENDIINGCMEGVKKVPALESFQSDFRNYCNCSAKKVFENHDVSELREIQDKKDKQKIAEFGMEALKSCGHILENAAKERGLTMPAQP